MCGGLKAELRRKKDRIDVVFPKLARIRVALKSMLNREYQRTIDGNSTSGVIPIGVCIINVDIRGDSWWGRVGIGVLSIAAEYVVVQLGRQSIKQPLNRLFHARGVRRY
jgi:hypothetical protein